MSQHLFRKLESPLSISSRTRGKVLNRPSTTEVVSSTLFERIANKDRSAVAECLDTHGALVWGISKKFTENNLEAEKLTEEIFACLWRCSVRFDPSYFNDRIFIMIIARHCINTRKNSIIQ